MFGGKSKDEKQQQYVEAQQKQIEKFKEKYHIEDLNPNDLDTVRQIASDLYGNGFMKAGMALSFSNAADQAKVTYLSALVEQNWIIMNQLTRLTKAIEALSKK